MLTANDRIIALLKECEKLKERIEYLEETLRLLVIKTHQTNYERERKQETITKVRQSALTPGRTHYLHSPKRFPATSCDTPVYLQ